MVNTMKPSRGSNRTATRAPNLKKEKGKASRFPANKVQEPKGNDKITEPKPLQKVKARRASPSLSNKRRVQDSWGPMPASTIAVVEEILDLSILANLALKRRETKESQGHLNMIKNKFLAHCAQLKVPMQKQRDVIRSSQRHQEETKKSVLGKTTLSSLEEDLKAVVSVLERTEEQTVSLQQACSTLRDELEEEEEKAKQILQMVDEGVLKLPSLPPQKDETTLESRLRKSIPECDFGTTARNLGAVLQEPAVTQDAQVLLLQAQKYADLIFPSLSSGPSHIDGAETRFS